MKFNNRNVFISPKAYIGKNVKIGDNTTIYDNVNIGDNSTICDNCIIGEPLTNYYKDIDNYQNPETIIGANALIRSHCIIYADSKYGKNLVTGNHAIIQGGTTVGDYCLFGTKTGIQGNCSIGNYTRLVYGNVVSDKTKIGNYVFMAVYCFIASDPQPPSYGLIGAQIGDFSVLTSLCSVMPGIEIGKHCLVSPNSVVTKNLEDYSFAVGSPARRLMDIRKIPSRTNPEESYYPWPYHFERGMPWEGIGFDKWQREQQVDE